MQILAPSAYAWNLFAVPPAIVSILLILLGSIVLIRNRISAESVALGSLIFCGSIWLFCHTFVYLSIDENLARKWLIMVNTAIIFVPSLLYLFATLMLRVTFKLRFYVIACFILSILFLISLYETKWFLANRNATLFSVFQALEEWMELRSRILDQGDRGCDRVFLQRASFGGGG